MRGAWRGAIAGRAREARGLRAGLRPRGRRERGRESSGSVASHNIKPPFFSFFFFPFGFFKKRKKNPLAERGFVLFSFAPLFSRILPNKGKRRNSDLRERHAFHQEEVDYLHDKYPPDLLQDKGDCKDRRAPGGATQRVNAKRLLSHVFDKREEGRGGGEPGCALRCKGPVAFAPLSPLPLADLY